MFECGELITICENVEADQADLNPSIGMRAMPCILMLYSPILTLSGVVDNRNVAERSMGR